MLTLASSLTLALEWLSLFSNALNGTFPVDLTNATSLGESFVFSGQASNIAVISLMRIILFLKGLLAINENEMNGRLPPEISNWANSLGNHNGSCVSFEASHDLDIC